VKSFKSFFLTENYDVPITHFTADGEHESFSTQNLTNKETRDEINVQLLRATAGQFTNPYLSLMKVAKLLAVYGVLLPKPYFPAVDGGELVWGINPEGQMHDYNTSVPASEKDEPKWFLYFEYGTDTDGAYVCYAEICDMTGLDDLLEEDLDEENLDESLPKNSSAGDYVKDFVHSKNKNFSGDSKKERIRRALGAYYSKKD
jgi:hypothetical protein